MQAPLTKPDPRPTVIPHGMAIGRFHGKPGRIFDRPLPRISRHEAGGESVGPDEHGLYTFTLEERAYLDSLGAGAWTWLTEDEAVAVYRPEPVMPVHESPKPAPKKTFFPKKSQSEKADEVSA